MGQMNDLRALKAVVLSAIISAGVMRQAPAVTISVDTTIGVGNTRYEMQDVLIDGSKVTIAGKHSFARVQLSNGGILTHPAGNASST